MLLLLLLMMTTFLRGRRREIAVSRKQRAVVNISTLRSIRVGNLEIVREFGTIWT